ncbi:aldo/keto reductase [Patescibacteria group bacterium]|nr:aldo/keto reductase [Patescibacteria group bacterium]
MKIPTKKLKKGFEMPVFGLGTWQMGGREVHNPQNDDKKDITAIQGAIKLGVTHIDTAEGYAEGYAEILIGKAIKGYNRSKLFIVSKVRPEHLRYDDVLRSCEASLKRLKTDYLDLYLIHSPSFEIPIEDTLRAMDKLLENGLVKNIGVSNFKTERLIEAQKYTRNKLVVNQVYYNLVIREPEKEGLLRYCQQNDILLEAYRPIEKGALLAQAIPILDELVRKYDKTPAQIAINWLISQKNVITLSKMSAIEHLKENLGALGWQMKSEDVESLRKEFPNQQERSETLPLR